MMYSYVFLHLSLYGCCPGVFLLLVFVQLLSKYPSVSQTAPSRRDRCTKSVRHSKSRTERCSKQDGQTGPFNLQVNS